MTEEEIAKFSARIDKLIDVSPHTPEQFLFKLRMFLAREQEKHPNMSPEELTTRNYPLAQY